MRRMDFDPEVAAIFTDEATELIDAAEHALADWRSQPASADYRLSLKRPLHTLKGGARMAGITPMGDLSHELESLVLLVETGKLTADAELFDAIQASLDELARMREQVVTGQRVAPARAIIVRLQSLSRPGGAAAAAPPEALAPAAAGWPAPAAPPMPVAAAPEAPAVIAPVAAPPAMEAERETRVRPAPAVVPASAAPSLELYQPAEVDTALARLNAELQLAAAEADRQAASPPRGGARACGRAN